MDDNEDGSEHDGHGVHGGRKEVDDEDEGKDGGWRHKEEHEVEMAEHDEDADKYEHTEYKELYDIDYAEL